LTPLFFGGKNAATHELREHEKKEEKSLLTNRVRGGNWELEPCGSNEPEGSSDAHSKHAQHEHLRLIFEVLWISNTLIKEDRKKGRGGHLSF